MSEVKMHSFQKCLEIADTGKKHVLLGNGFSRACRDNIFSYISLFESTDFENKNNLKDLFTSLGTTDFEEIMNVLLNCASVLEVYDKTNTSLLKSVLEDEKSLKSFLVSTLTKNHPENPSDILDTEYENCIKFISNFERIFTLNYDLLLYWALMKAESLRDDGFRDPYEGDPEDYFAEDFVVWSNGNHKQNIYYLHGALHLFMSKTRLQKFSWVRTGVKLKDQIEKSLKSNKFPLVVSEGKSEQKMAKIQRSNYLGSCLRSLGAVTGNLFIYGLSMSQNDEHILNEIRKNSKLKKIFVSFYGDAKSSEARRLREVCNGLKTYKGKDNGKEIYIYNAKTVRVW